MLPAHDGTVLGRPVTAGHLATVAGTGVCGSAGQGGPMSGRRALEPGGGGARPRPATSSSRTAATSRCCWRPPPGATYWGTAVGAGDIGVVVGGTGGYGPYLADGLSATGETAELNDPRGVAVGPTGALFVSDGFMQAVRVVPETTGTLVGRHMVAGDLNTAVGAVPVSSSAGLGDGTKWVVTRVGTPAGVAVSSRRVALYVSDAGLDTVRVIGGTGVVSPDQPPPLPGLVGRGGRRGRAWPTRSPARSDRRGGRAPRPRPRRRRHRPRLEPDAVLRTTARPHAPRTSRSTGRSHPLGVDPDGCSFAWTLDAPGRNVTQAAYQIVVRRTDPGHAGAVWDSGTVESAQQAFVAYAGPALAADAAYTWTVRAKAAAGRLGPHRPAPPRSSPVSVTPTGTRRRVVAPDRPAPPPSPTGSRTCATRSPRPAAAPSSGPRPTSPPPTPTASSSTAVAVDAWPSFSYPDEQYVRAVDLTRALRPGATPTPSASCTAGTDRARGVPPRRPVSSSRCRSGTTMGDTSSTAPTARGGNTRPSGCPSPQRNGDGGDFVEWIDGRAYPEGWSGPGYDDSDWSPATVIGPAGSAPFTHTYAQRTDIEETTVLPVRLHSLPNGSVVADFGAVYAARPRVEFASGVPGQTVALRVGYLLDPDGQVSTLHGTQGTNLSFTYIMRDGAQVFEAFTYLGFRYLQIDGAGQRLGRGQVAALARHTAMPAVPMATFSTGNRMLDAVWRLNARSCLYCSQEQFVDTPTREKGQFTWDAANESEAIMRCYGDQNLSWQGLRDVARGQARYWPDGRTNAVYPNGDGARSFATFSARYVEWLWRYYTGHGRPGDGDRRSTRRRPRWPTGCGRPARRRRRRQRSPLRAGRHQQRRPRLRLRPHGGGRHGQQRAGGQRLQSGGPAGRRGRRRRRPRPVAVPGGRN